MEDALSETGRKVFEVKTLARRLAEAGAAFGVRPPSRARGVKPQDGANDMSMRSKRVRR